MAQINSELGVLEVGDTVQTLDRKRGITGVVTKIKRGRVFITGTHYEGGPEVKCEAHIENVAIVNKGKRNG